MTGLHQCPPCGFRFEDPQSLIDHEEACPGDESYACNECGQTIDSPNDELDHERVCPARDEEEEFDG